MRSFGFLNHIAGIACVAMIGILVPYGAKADYYSSIVMLDETDIPGSVESLESRGVKIINVRENLALCFVPTSGRSSKSFAKSTLKGVKGVKHEEVTPRRNFTVPTLDVGREWYEAYKVQEGLNAGLPKAYDGSGVVVGLCDTGFDPNHPNFLGSDGKSRVRLVTYTDETQATRDFYSTPDQISGYDTDNRAMTHATHVAGIAAGSNSTYTGMAPGADIVFCGTKYLTDGCILMGVEDIISYAKSVGKPAVINLSLGNYTGPHDGSTLFNRYLDMCAEEAIICLASGNTGNGQVYYAHDFTTASPTFSIRTTDWNGLNPYGQTEVWSVDGSSFKFQPLLYNTVKDIIYLDEIELGDSGYWAADSDPSSLWYNEKFAEIFSEGAIEVTGEISPLNGRYYVAMYYDAHTDVYDGDNTWAKYMLGFRATGEPGTGVECYIDTSYSFFRSIGNGPQGNSLRSISDLACGYNTISVGMTTNRNSIPFLNGNVATVSDTPGAPDRNSSYGTLNDGRVHPATIAPGAYIISSYSKPYVDYLTTPGVSGAVDPSQIPQLMSGEESYAGSQYYYRWEHGTSMACPYVVGGIACWLQADPTLKHDEVRKLLLETNRQDYPLYNDNAFAAKGGMGAFDCYAGLKKVLGNSLTVQPYYEGVGATLTGKLLNVLNPGSAPLVLRVFNLSGSECGYFRSTASEAHFDLSSYPAGVYTIAIHTSSGATKIFKAVL